jgi:transcriptional regulator with XRE-family HTH domain
MVGKPHGRQLLRAWLERSVKQQNELARELGITDAYLSQALTGARRPKLEILVEIERVTGVPVESWVEIDDADLDDERAGGGNGSAFQRAKRPSEPTR